MQARINLLVTLFLTLIILVGPDPCWPPLAFLKMFPRYEQRTDEDVCLQQYVLVRFGGIQPSFRFELSSIVRLSICVRSTAELKFFLCWPLSSNPFCQVCASSQCLDEL